MKIYMSLLKLPMGKHENSSGCGFNHCSEDIMQFRDVCEKGKNSKYYNWFIIHGDSVNADRDNYEILAVVNICRSGIPETNLRQST